MEKKMLIPYNLQFFAEGDDPDKQDDKGTPDKQDKTPDDKGKPDEQPDDKDSQSPKTIEEQLADALAKQKMLEKKLDKTSEKLSATEQKYNEVLTDAQKIKVEEAERKAEAAEELERLRKENAVNRYEKTFLALGYPEELAKEAAEAQYDKDDETVLRIQREFLIIHDKQKEAEWQAKRPLPQSGADDGEGSNITLDELNRMSYKKQLEFKQAHPETYAKITGGN